MHLCLSKVTGVVVGVALLWAGGVGAAPPSPAKSLQACQRTVRQKTRSFIKDKFDAVGKCLLQVSHEIVAQNSPNAHDAVKECTRSFDKLEPLETELREDITAKCEPGQPNVMHSLDDLLGTGTPGVAQPLQVSDLGTYCAHFGGDGSIDSVSEWLDCQVAVSECTVDAALAVQYPRGLEWLDLVRSGVAARSATAGAALDRVFAAIDGTPAGDFKPDIRCGPAGGTSFPATGQTTSDTAGDDGDIQAGATLSYTDNKDGTITDNNTGLMWEKKSADGTIHDKDTRYTWANAFAVHVAGLNTAPCFAGHCDWRLPNVKELQSIVNYQSFPPAFTPAVSAAFHTTRCVASCAVTTCSCTAAAFYWSSTSFAPVPAFAWGVGFGFVEVPVAGKNTSRRVRAVRGGQ